MATMTESQWAAEVLRDLGAPVTANNVDNMLRWMTDENYPATWATRNNPLNSSLGTSAADGTGSYPSLDVAASEVAAMLRQSNMAGIRQALVDNADVDTFSAAVVASPWASSHYGGNPLHVAQTPLPQGAPAADGAPSSLGLGQTSGSAYQLTSTGPLVGGLEGVPEIGPLAAGILGLTDANGNPIAAADKAVKLFGLLFTAEPWVRAAEIGWGSLLAVNGFVLIALAVAEKPLRHAAPALAELPGPAGLVGGLLGAAVGSKRPRAATSRRHSRPGRQAATQVARAAGAAENSAHTLTAGIPKAVTGGDFTRAARTRARNERLAKQWGEPASEEEPVDWDQFFEDHRDSRRANRAYYRREMSAHKGPSQARMRRGPD